MRYLIMCIVFVFISSGMISCTLDPIEDQQNTIRISATGDDSEVTPPPSEETGEDDELEPNS